MQQAHNRCGHSGAVHQRGGEVRNDGEEEHHRAKVSDYCQRAMGVEHGAFSAATLGGCGTPLSGSPTAGS